LGTTWSYRNSPKKELLPVSTKRGFSISSSCAKLT
jgi:hypothetical protein